MILYRGNCLEEMNKIADKSVDLILTDLPYGSLGCSWDIIIPFEPLWKHWKRVGGTVCLFGSEPFSSLIRTSNIDWFKYDWVWKKTKSSNFLQANFQPIKVHEMISIFSPLPATFVRGNSVMAYNPEKSNGKIAHNKGQDTGLKGWRASRAENYHIKSTNTEGKYPTSILEFPSVQNPIHPTQKPVELLEYLIKTYTEEGQTVLDCCMGSGSTGIACLNTKREFIGIEMYPLPGKEIDSKKNPEWFNIAKDRLDRHQFKPATKPDKYGKFEFVLR